MRLTELLKSALSSIWSRKIRAFLTSLGVIIGVFAVAALLSIGQASVTQMNENMSDLNADIIDVVMIDNIKFGLSHTDLLMDYNSIDNVAPYIKSSGILAKGNNSTKANIIATTSGYCDIKNTALIKGRFISNIDVDHKLKSVVLGLSKCLEMYATTDVIGQKLFISGIEFTVIGVLSEQKASLLNNPNHEIIIPITAGQTYFNMGDIQNVSILPEKYSMEQAKADADKFFNSQFGSAADYTITTDENLKNYINESNKTMMTLLGGIGGISLLISGIGIMNIMLVSVRERTKEIGIRKSIGAKRKDILLQFLIEAMVISLFGGIMGVGITFVSTNILEKLIDMKIVLEVWIMLIATVFSLIVGIVFGLYPAVKASKLRPVEALYYE